MAASTSSSKGAELSKAEYLKRYLSADEDPSKSKGKIKKKRRKVPERGLKIVDDDIDWRQMVTEQTEVEEDEEEAPVIAEVIDERPEDVKQLEVFRSGNKWKVIGADENKEDEEERENVEPVASSSAPQESSKGRKQESPVRKTRHDSPDVSPPRRGRHDSPDLSPSREHLRKPEKAQSKDSSPARRKPSSSSHSKRSPEAKKAQKRHDSDSDQSPPRKKTTKREASDSDQSPPRRRSKIRRDSDSDQSPPRRRPQSGKDSDGDLSPPRRPGPSQGHRMLSGGKAGLVSVDILRKEQEENRRRDKNNQPLEDESRNAQTVFRDKSGKRRDLESEREEQKRKAGEKAAKDEKYAQWGKGLAQSEMRQQKLEDALHEAQKPLARHHDDEDLDRMLREQEREGDPMAAMLRRKKDKNKKAQEKPRYNGPPPPPNRFNILPGYRWDGVDRSNGFEQKRYARIADKKAVQEAAYKWSVEDL
ncbi:BUD13 homolog [Kryptolebias marmoratus]|uniref:BUD13 homolog n=1 Tax=Kryptolebias marmoratus TaxID=37003 RepID=A0A3Q3BSU6_KRYMA|nr:BUD13 homolog [Kryptolebias marmoratus]